MVIILPESRPGLAATFVMGFVAIGQTFFRSKLMRVKPLVLIILDGWGYRPERRDNAIALANTPTWDKLWQTYAHTFVSGSGEDVGLPGRQMGNSEVGHTNLGAGRVVYQNLTRIDRDIAQGDFNYNTAFNQLIDKLLVTGNTLHLMGLVSDGGVHSHYRHLIALIKLAAERGVKKIAVHAFLDGRDTAPKSAKLYLAEVQKACRAVNIAEIVSVIGRYYAMDRDNRWERIEATYNMLTKAEAPFHAVSVEQAVEMAYERGETDEFVQPTLIADQPEDAVCVQPNDGVCFMNFRADRARQLTQAFVLPALEGFDRDRIPLAGFVALTEYEADLPVSVAYPPEQLVNVLGEYLSQHQMTQLRIAETEKYAHVTFFFNGGVEVPFSGEDRVLVPSPKVATYDLQPEMSAPELTDKLVEAIGSEKYDVIICNYANADMVGHTGQLAAAIKAIEAIDQCLQRVTEALLAVGGEALITADHGNAELMVNEETGQPHTAHTNLVVPLIYVGRPAKVVVDNAVLSDIAPTMLRLLSMSAPKEMTGRAIFEIADKSENVS